MRRPLGLLLSTLLAVSVAAAASGCGVFASQKDHEALSAKSENLEKSLEAEKTEIAALKTDLEATRARLDNALRANADRGSDIMSERARVNQVAGRIDEVAHTVDDVKKDLAATRSELDQRIDDMKRAQEAQQPKPPPVTIPPDNRAHYAAIEAASAQQDWELVRTLGREFINRYPTDDKVDDVAYAMGDANMKDNRPSSALGEFNRVLKASPPSNVLDKTLFAMGEAYLLLHDCENAKLAFGSCASRFAKTKLGQQARARVNALEKAPPGTCAP